MPFDRLPLDRRTLLTTGLASTGIAAAGLDAAFAGGPREPTSNASNSSPALTAVEGADQTAELQAAVDNAAQAGVPLVLPAGRFLIGNLELRPNTRIIGASRQTVIEFTGGSAFLTARDAPGVRLEGFVIDGNLLGIDANRATGLVSFDTCDGLSLRDLEIRRGLLNGIALARSSGAIRDCTLREMSQAGLRSLDGRGLDISHNAVLDCSNNGIQIWRTSAGDDGSIVYANRIERIAAKGGGSGQNGNGINIYRAGGVSISGNRITDCAYSAIRGNAADNIQMVGNSCRNIGEVALYAEFGFEGALIANNLIEQAASGIAVTNFNEGGRLAVVQGNLVRDLRRREHEPVDKRGVGIGIEADAAVSGNVIEGAPTAGIIAGWGPYLRDVAITGNLIRNAGVGILVTSDAAAGACLVSQNMISGAKNGAIRAMDHGAPHGPELASSDGAIGRLMLRGNLAV